MSIDRQEHKANAVEQPGTQPTNPGDEVPAGTPGSGENICPDCGGSGRRENAACPTCGGTGIVIEAVSGGA